MTDFRMVYWHTKWCDCKSWMVNYFNSVNAGQLDGWTTGLESFKKSYMHTSLKYLLKFKPEECNIVELYSYDLFSNIHTSEESRVNLSTQRMPGGWIIFLWSNKYSNIHISGDRWAIISTNLIPDNGIVQLYSKDLLSIPTSTEQKKTVCVNHIYQPHHSGRIWHKVNF